MLIDKNEGGKNEDGNIFVIAPCRSPDTGKNGFKRTVSKYYCSLRIGRGYMMLRTYLDIQL